MHQEVFMKTLHEMNDSISQEIAKQPAQFQLFLEDSNEQIIQAVRTPMFASTTTGHGGSGMMSSLQYSIPNAFEFPSTLNATCGLRVHSHSSKVVLV